MQTITVSAYGVFIHYLKKMYFLPNVYILFIIWYELAQPKYNQLWGFVCFVVQKRGKHPKLQPSGSVLGESVSLYKSRHYKSPHAQRAANWWLIFWCSYSVKAHTLNNTLDTITQKGHVLTLTKAKLLCFLLLSFPLISVISSKTVRN